MRSAWPISLGVLFVLAVTFSILLRDDPLEFSQTTYGVLPSAYGALHDTFAELGLPVARSFAAPEDLPTDATVWWIEPDRLCVKLDPEDDPADPSFDPTPFLEAGGTAVIFAEAFTRCRADTTIAGLLLPRSVAHDDPDREEDDATDDEEASDESDPFTEAFGRNLEWEAQWVTGPPDGTRRSLPIPPLSRFVEPSEAFTVVARVDDEPFALEAKVGNGRLVLIADSLFLRNLWLDAGDAAPLAFDWVRAYGVPHFDEREHGLHQTPSTLDYLANSPALPVFAGLGTAGLLFAWAGARLPERRVGLWRPTPPTLRTYVDSLARLFARANDPDEMLRHYRAHVLRRLRETLGLDHEASLSRVEAKLRQRASVDDGDLAWLRGGSVADGAALARACDSLDRLLEAAR